MRTIGGLVALVVFAGSGWVWHTYNGLHPPKLDAISTAKPSGTTAVKFNGKDQNILIVGNDDRETATDAELKQLGTGRDGGSLNTDTMMLLHVPANGSKATVISFPRDSYVAIPGFGMNKLNAAYSFGTNAANGDRSTGARLLVQTIQDLTGLTINHFVSVDLIGFYRISNAIGGVPVNLCEAQREPNSGINLPAGWSNIKGTQALAFVRQRYGLPNGDLDRIKRQQYFLSAAFHKLTSGGVLLSPSKLTKVIDAVNKSVYVDKNFKPIQLVEQMQSLTSGNLTFSTIPTNGFADNEAGSVVVVDPAEVRAWVAKQVRATNAKSPKPGGAPPGPPATGPSPAGASSPGSAMEPAGTGSPLAAAAAPQSTGPSATSATQATKGCIN
ncbi:MAG: LCP family protein [Actinomycetia bacterium]|nr:LCP family protein [Actinomycetes bacterium]